MKIDRCDTSFGLFNIKKTESSIAVGGTKFCVNKDIGTYIMKLIHGKNLLTNLLIYMILINISLCIIGIEMQYIQFLITMI
jgi:hypothetical protein